MAEASNTTQPPGPISSTGEEINGYSLWQLGVAVGRYASGSQIGVALHTTNVSLGELTEQTNSLMLAKTNISMSSFYMSSSCDHYLSSSGMSITNPSSSQINSTGMSHRPEGAMSWSAAVYGQRWESHIGSYWKNYWHSNAPTGWSNTNSNIYLIPTSGSGGVGGKQGSPLEVTASYPASSQVDGVITAKYADEFNYYRNPATNYGVLSQSRNVRVKQFGGGG
tara:strand:+ start:742 stop:1410 length:669 start_codon:yes stop_codon:yes gene_type:complete